MLDLEKMKWAIGVLVATLSIPAVVNAETQMRVEAEKKLRPAQNLTLTPSAQLRLTASPFQVGSLLPGLALRYRLLPQLSLGTGYRFNYDRNRSGVFRAKQRVHVDVSSRWRGSAWQVKGRLRFQEQWRETRRGEIRHRPSLRGLMQAKWQVVPTVASFLSAEHFLALEKLSSTQSRKWRLGFGAQWETALVEVQASYRLDIPIAVEEGERAHILTLGVAL